MRLRSPPLPQAFAVGISHKTLLKTGKQRRQLRKPLLDLDAYLRAVQCESQYDVVTVIDEMQKQREDEEENQRSRAD